MMPTSPGSARLACGLGALPEIDLPAVGVQAVKTSARPFVNKILLFGGNRLKRSLLQRLSIIRGQLLIGFSEKQRLQKPKDALNHGRGKCFPT